MKKLFEFISNKIIPFGIIFLVFFIPLMPKIPIVDIFGTWVYIRLEDFLVAILIGLYLLIRWCEHKFTDSKLTFPIIFYWIIGGISLLNSLLFIGPHLPNYLPHLALLHYLRRFEYMMLFFVAYETFLRRKTLIKPVIWIVALTLVLIFSYGVGQKFFGFPAFLTMNEEFAKGAPLRLPPTARIVSTFGGHYDLAAYLVLMIPIAGSLVFGLQKIWQKLVFFLITLGSVILLLFTASRISFGVYLVAITTMLVWQKKKILIIPVVIGSFILLNFVSSASERFYKTFRYEDVIIDLSTGKPIGTLEKLEGSSAVLEEQESPAEENLPKGSGFIGTGASAGSDIAVNYLIISKDLTTGIGEVATLSGSFLIQKALVYDISITTRFQGEWPKAIAAFKRNLLLGSGYSTLSVAVDGNYFRMLGETGIFGTIAFLGILALAYNLYFNGRKELDPLKKAFVTGFFAGLTGLLLNAILIDVFEASKVAFSFWLLMGISIAILSHTSWSKSYFAFLKSLLLSNIAINMYVFFGTFFLYHAALSGYFIGDDFTWLRWAAESSWSDIAKGFLESAGFFYRPFPKLWYFILYSVFWLKSGAYHIISVALYASLCLLLYQVLLAQKTRKLIALLAALLYSGLVIHHENVFWISGQSSLLGANFLFLAILITFKNKNQNNLLIKRLLTGVMLLSTFLSMVSYDSLGVAPLIIIAILYFLHKQRGFSVFLVMFLLPLYWILRTASNALLPSGDYGYKISTFGVNSIVNTLTYITSSIIGPKIIDAVSYFRAMLRSYLLPLTASMTVILLILAIFAQKIRYHVVHYSAVYIWILCMFISLIPFLGLGGAAERYALVPSAFLIIFLTVSVTNWLRNEKKLLKYAIVCILYIAVFYWNRIEYLKIAQEWKFANTVSEQTMLKLKHAYFPFGDKKTFIFVDTPIRFGRAWIFPTGLSDALWHIFRQAPFKVIQMTDVEEALAYYTYKGQTVVNRFENYVLKHVELRLLEDENEKK